MFDGEFEEAVDAWLLNIKRYFQVYNYDDNLRACLAIFQLSGKASLWWQKEKSVNNIHNKELSWKFFKKLLKTKYMFERYYDEKAKEFNDLRLGQFTMEEFVTKFVNL